MVANVDWVRLPAIGEGCRPFAGHMHVPIRLGLHCAPNPSQSVHNDRNSGLVARISRQMARNILLQIVGKKSSYFFRHVSAQFGCFVFQFVK
jgi:hypothetical protein